MRDAHISFPTHLNIAASIAAAALIHSHLYAAFSYPVCAARKQDFAAVVRWVQMCPDHASFKLKPLLSEFFWYPQFSDSTRLDIVGEKQGLRPQSCEIQYLVPMYFKRA